MHTRRRISRLGSSPCRTEWWKPAPRTISFIALAVLAIQFSDSVQLDVTHRIILTVSIAFHAEVVRLLAARP